MAVVTNLSPNHLDVHKDMQEYIDAKKNILLHQNCLSRTVLNAGNAVTASFAPGGAGGLLDVPPGGRWTGASGAMERISTSTGRS